MSRVAMVEERTTRNVVTAGTDTMSFIFDVDNDSCTKKSVC